MDQKLLYGLLFAGLIYLKLNEGKKNYLCWCIIALIVFGLFTTEKLIEGFNNIEPNDVLSMRMKSGRPQVMAV